MKALVVLAAFASLGLADPRLSIGLDEHVGVAVPRDLTFTDSTGTSIALGSLFDGHRPVVLVMAYARCRLLCSVVLRGIADAIETSTAVLGRDYTAVVVSLDPHETPDEAARRQNKLLAGVHRSERAAWPYLVGDEATIKALAGALGFHYAWDPRTEQYAHPAVAFVLTPDGRIAEYLRGVTFDGLAEAVARAARGELTPSTTRDLLACFHFDPAMHRYEKRIGIIYTLVGLIVLGSMTALIGGLVMWERRRTIR